MNATGGISFNTVMFNLLSLQNNKDMDYSDKLSLVSVTHYSPRESYGDLSPPSVGIVKQTINSFRKNMDGLQNCPHYIVYNKPKDYSYNKKARQYCKNIRDFSQSNENINVVERENEGLRSGLLTGMNQTDTPYILFVEHDWELIEKINVNNVIKEFEKNDKINSIRFNRRKNIEAGWDTYVVEDKSKSIPLCKTSNVGNNPQIVRKSELYKWIEKSNPDLISVLTSFYCHYSTPHNFLTLMNSLYEKYVIKKDAVRYFDDLEKILDAKYKKQINNDGFKNAHEEWGVYLYGNKGQGPYVTHLGR